MNVPIKVSKTDGQRLPQQIPPKRPHPPMEVHTAISTKTVNIVTAPITCIYHTEYSPVFVSIKIYTVCNGYMLWTGNNYWHFFIWASYNVRELLYRTDTNQNSIRALNVSEQLRNPSSKFSVSSFLDEMRYNVFIIWRCLSPPQALN